MRNFILYFALFIGQPMQLLAQIDAKSAHQGMAKTVVELYNSKNFNAIYKFCNTSFKKANEEDEFIQFFEENLFREYGLVESYKYLQDEKTFHSFLLQFKTQSLQMNLSLNDSGEITALHYIPYYSKVAIKLQQVASDNPLLSALDSLVDQTVKDYGLSPQNCGLSIGILINGTQHYYNYGELSRGLSQLPDQNSIYEIGSITKTFTALLLAMAVVEGKLSLEDDIRKYILGNYPNLAFNDQAIRIVHLANHSSGLPRIPLNLTSQSNFDSLNPYRNYTKKMILSYLHTIRLSEAPGTKSEYSNFGVAVLGLILESVYNKDFEQLLKDKILIPYQLNSTGIHLSDEQELKFAKGYTSLGKETPHWELGAFIPAGGLRSGTKDVLNYLALNLSEKDSALKLSHQSTFNKNENIALLWQIQSKSNGSQLYWHNGSTYGSSSFCAFIKEKKSAIVILSNSAMSVDYLAISLLKFLAKSP